MKASRIAIIAAPLAVSAIIAAPVLETKGASLTTDTNVPYLGGPLLPVWVWLGAGVAGSFMLWKFLR